MDTYEKKYEEALKRAKKLYEQGTITESLSYVFPELHEQEDERIKKELITHCRNTRCVTEEGAERIAKWIAWIEKQGEQKAILDELEMTLSVSEDAYLRSNLEKLIKELKKEEQ